MAFARVFHVLFTLPAVDSDTVAILPKVVPAALNIVCMDVKNTFAIPWKFAATVPINTADCCPT